MSKTSVPAFQIDNGQLLNYEQANLEYRYMRFVENSAPVVGNQYHWHKYYEIIFIKEGRYRLVNNRKTIESDEPGVFIHRPYSLHNLNSLGRVYRRRVIFVTREIVNRFTWQTVDADAYANANLIYAHPNLTEWEELDFYIDLTQKHQEEPNVLAHVYALMFQRIISIAEEGRGEIVRCPFSYIQDVLNYILDNLAENNTIEVIAARFNTGRSKLQSDFKAVTGMSFHQYIVTLRLNRAYRLLLEGERSVVQVAMETGYSSEAHFIKAFREHWGITPGQLRKQNGVSVISGQTGQSGGS